MGLFSRIIRTFGPVGGYEVARQICRSQPRILMYHRFSSAPAEGKCSSKHFEDQVKHIKRNYNPFSLIGLMEYQREHGRFPPHAVVITVDDGYRDFYQYAFPILKKYDVPATLFATTGFIEREHWLWPDKITWLLNEVSEIPETIQIDLIELPSGPVSAENRPVYWKRLNDHALSLPDQEKQQFIGELTLRLNTAFPLSIPGAYEPLNWEELRELQDSGIEIGGHTVTHPSLGRVDEEQAKEEIFGCMESLTKNLGERPRTFCYPNGQPSDFKPFLPGIVERAGFYGAVTAFPDARGVAEPYLMRRHASGDDMFQFFKSVSGAELIGLQLRSEVRLGMGAVVASYGR
ncbi:polysaccharide deacetylase family protein [Marinobacter shengliensis]|uniref:polysaccharide deacetylase family protein n=1 Tax=Marinobacter shengliensis TaxID=1389223 RepID=UPI001E46F135|nr:polysaccharide deacetylase family protein [Marinobacter shengliensis]MCD1631306.1 polysaccharide deacetylase family protein [Marinobacter shengliensis]